MEGKLQNQITFYLTGQDHESALRRMDASFRPAVFARYGDLNSLRYDFPLILNREEISERPLLSLSGLVDQAISILREDPDIEQIARHGYRLEREIRRELSGSGAKDFVVLWNEAALRLVEEGGESFEYSARQLWSTFHASGDIVDADSALPTRVLRHAWSALKESKSKKFREKSARLLQKLQDILAAEIDGSPKGRTPERLRAGVGYSFAGAFDFDALSRILVEAKPGIELSDGRRRRIRKLINVLERQRFYPSDATLSDTYNFEFERCTDALKAYRERHDEAIELVKTLAMAALESTGEYRESVHDAFFEGFGANGLDIGAIALLPDYLVCAEAKSLGSEETSLMVEILSAGLPVKVLVQTDDILEPSAITLGRATLGLRVRQLVNTAIGLTDVFVFQSSASDLFLRRGSLMDGLHYEGPALFSVFSGANSRTGGFRPYLVAAAATESRVFPTLVYDPSAGSDWATRLVVDGNPRPDDDWMVHTVAYEDENLQAKSEELAFTLADFMAMDERFFHYFAIVPTAEWSDSLIPVPEALQANPGQVLNTVPFIRLVDGNNRIHWAITDACVILETRRCRTMWHSLQELGGIHNSHAERLLAQARKISIDRLISADEVRIPLTGSPVKNTEASALESIAAESHGDGPYIETARCTSCNECTRINGKLFAYDENKQAYIADHSAGTFRQLVEAAEGCQVSIIHPGKPKNPKEPGLDDLIRRAAEFN